jgi:hypothetical protein
MSSKRTLSKRSSSNRSSSKRSSSKKNNLRKTWRDVSDKSPKNVKQSELKIGSEYVILQSDNNAVMTFLGKDDEMLYFYNNGCCCYHEIEKGFQRYFTTASGKDVIKFDCDTTCDKKESIVNIIKNFKSLLNPYNGDGIDELFEKKACKYKKAEFGGKPRYNKKGRSILILNKK